MENIIVGFDFSTGSANAVDLAIDIANRWGRDIRLVYVKPEGEDETPIRTEIEQRIAAVGNLLHGIKLEYVIRQGNVSSELNSQAKSDNASLIIVGTNGMSGFKRNWLGKNTYRTIADSRIPVLSVREGYDFRKTLDKIVFPIDSSDATRQKVAIAAKFAKTFGSEIYLLGLNTSEAKDIRSTVTSFVKQVATYLDKSDVKYNAKIVDVPKNITLTTLDYASSINADMIVIMTEQEKRGLSDLVLDSYAQQMLTMSNIPILSLRPEQINGAAK